MKTSKKDLKNIKVDNKMETFKHLSSSSFVNNKGLLMVAVLKKMEKKNKFKTLK